LEGSFEVLHAPTISGARKIFQDTVPSMIFMDINLGEFTTGLDLTRMLREDPRFKNIPIVAVTAYAMKSDREAAFDAGCTDFLAKPFTRAQLFDVVERTMVSVPGD